MASNFLSIGNPRKVKTALQGIVDQTAIDAIENEIAIHTIRLMDLAFSHYRFAVKQPPRSWRQKVSRLYYAGYSASKAIRFYYDGQHTTDVKDHQKIGDLPDEFPRKGYFKNKLGVLRVDRNTCDYDHSAYSSDLLNHHAETEELLKDFLTEAKAYLKSRGLIVKGKI